MTPRKAASSPGKPPPPPPACRRAICVQHATCLLHQSCRGVLLGVAGCLTRLRSRIPRCRVFEAAESGDVDELSELTTRLAELDVSIDTRVRPVGQAVEHVRPCPLGFMPATQCFTRPGGAGLHIQLLCKQNQLSVVLLPGSLAVQGADSDTPLHLAALYGHAECVRLLLERGARADVADSDGALPSPPLPALACSC